MPQKRYAANPNVTCRREADGAVLFSPASGHWLGTNEVGGLIWQALARPRTLDEIVARLAQACREAPAGQLAADVEAFLDSLQARGFAGEVLEDENSLPDALAASAPLQPESALSAPPPEQERHRYYQGHSMLGAFRPGDYLIVEPAPMATIRPGDVVVYRAHSQAGAAGDVVHRVVALRPGGLATMGDNNRRLDQGLVTAERLLGRVTCAERGGLLRRVRGGRWGLIQARARRLWQGVKRLGWRLLGGVGRRPYRWLRESGLARYFWRPAIMRLLIASSGGPLVQLIHGRRVVARWWPHTGRFVCRKPYDLILAPPRREMSGYETVQIRT